MARLPEIEGLADAAADRLRMDLEALLLKVHGYLDGLLAKAEVDGMGRLIEGSHNAGLAATLGEQLAGVLTQLGYDAALHGLITDFEEISAATDALNASRFGASFGSIGEDTLTAFVSGAIDDMLALKGAAAERLRDVMLQGIATQVPRDKELDALATALNGTFAEARTLADTSLMGFHRAVMASQAENAGIDLFVYAGPEDALDRPFCAAHVGKVYTTSDLDQDDNDQGLEPTSVYLGGYNCRHFLSPISVDEAQAMAAEDIAGPEARRIVLRGGTGFNESQFVAAYRGAVVGNKVVRRGSRRAA